MFAAPTGLLLDVQGELRAGDTPMSSGAVADAYDVLVTAGQALTVTVTSAAVDTVLFVQPPGGVPISNDDFQGNRAVAQVQVVPAISGPMKVTVTAPGPAMLGAYRLMITGAQTAAPPAAGVAVTPAWQELRIGADSAGTFAPGDARLPSGQLVDNYLLAGGVAQNVDVVVQGAGFAPLLFVSTPAGQGLSAAPEGSGARATLSLAQMGAFRVQVVAPAPGGVGQYTVGVRPSTGAAPTQIASVHHRAAAGNVAPGPPVTVRSTTSGRLDLADTRLETGETVDRYSLTTSAVGEAYSIDLQSSAFDPYLLILAPSGRRFENDDSNGTRNAQVVEALPEVGVYQVLVTSYQAGETGDYVLKVEPGPGAAAPVPVAQVADAEAERRGELAPGDPTLSSGELTDSYTFQWTPGQRVSVRLTSAAFDPYVIVRAPSGRQQDNDDVSQGVRDAGLEYAVTEAGLHTVVATSYQAGERGAYVLTVGGAGATVAPPPTPTPPPAGGDAIRGALEASDAPDPAGRRTDRHSVALRIGEQARIELSSSQFDTVLRVEPPSGRPMENDDVVQGNTNSAVDLVAQTGGAHTVVVTSYRPGEMGTYEVRVIRGASGGTTPPAGGGPTPAPTPASDRPIAGTLAAGDAALSSGEFVDRFTIDGTVGQMVRVRLTSSAFDPYVILKSPSGRQDDNDDMTPQTRDAGLDVALTEAGAYTLMVTSYRAGESGEYRLTIDRRTPQTRGGRVVAEPGVAGGRTFGIFAGITDYATQSDLPECANDARKLAETLRETGLMTEGQQIVLTDGQVTTAAIRQAFAAMTAQVGPGDTFLFFFSGHGNQIAAGTDRNELDQKDETIVLQDGEIVDDEMARMYAGIRGRVSLISLDSCFSGGFAKDVISAQGRMGMFSSEEDLTSAVAGQFQAGGYLSHFLRMGISGEADSNPRDGQLLAGELSHYLFRQFAAHVGDVGATDQNFARSFQHLVVDRGAVHVSDLLFAYR